MANQNDTPTTSATDQQTNLDEISMVTINDKISQILEKRRFDKEFGNLKMTCEYLNRQCKDMSITNQGSGICSIMANRNDTPTTSVTNQRENVDEISMHTINDKINKILEKRRFDEELVNLKMILDNINGKFKDIFTTNQGSRIHFTVTNQNDTPTTSATNRGKNVGEISLLTINDKINQILEKLKFDRELVNLRMMIGDLNRKFKDMSTTNQELREQNEFLVQKMCKIQNQIDNIEL